MEEQIVADERIDEDAGEEEATWRRRALAAESRLEQVEQELAGAHEAVDAAERRRETERLLTEHGALDMETALLLTEAAVSQMDEPDVAGAVEELRRRKPFLFRAASTASAMSRVAEGAGDALERAAVEARESGDRRLLLRYLRLKRSGG
jgi:hypothetical protein